MSRGGARQGAGRKKGVPNKVTAARQAEVAASGKTPLEVMLDNMRFATQEAELLLGKLQGSDVVLSEGVELLRKYRQFAQDCAKDAAPYIHPRLASAEHGGNQAKPVQMVMRVEFVRAKDGKPAFDMPPLLNLPANVVNLPPPPAS